jgi:uncharacterized membrane protein
MTETSGEPGTGRIEAFSDGVIAIIITIMVLELKLPQHAADHGLWAGVLEPLAPKLISYALSFLIIAIMWVNHRALLHTVHSPTRALVWWNNNLLFWTSLVPLATAFLGENPLSPLAVGFYAVSQFAVVVSFGLLRTYVWQQGHPSADVMALHRRMVWKNAAAAALYVVSVPLAFVSVYFSMTIFAAVLALYFLPESIPQAARRRRHR